MKIIKFVPKTNKSSETINVTNIVKDACGFSYKNSFDMAEESFTLKSPMNGINDLSTCAKIWVGIKKDDSYWSYETTNKNGFNNETVEYDLYEADVEFKTKYTLDELLKTKTLEYKVNVNDPYDVWDLFKIKSITAPDHNNINFEELLNMIVTSVPNGTHKYNLYVVFNDDSKRTLTIEIEVNNKNKNFNISMENITFTYAFFSPVYSQSIKPVCEIKCFTSKNLILDKVEFYNGDKLIQTEKDISKIINLNINGLTSYQKNEVTAKFYVLNTDTNSNEIIEDTKGILVSDSINAKLIYSYDKSEDVYKVSLKVSDDEKDNIQKIIWQVGYDSTVMENIISAGSEPLKMYSSVVFEDTTDNTKLDLTFDFKEQGEYTVTAYVIDISGKTHKTKTYIQTSNSKKDDNAYNINEKVNVVIKSDDGKTPSFTIYHIKDDSLVKDKVIITDKLFDNIYGSHFTIEHNDCVYLVQSKNSFKLYHVGDSNNIVVITLNPNISKLPEYVFKDFDGNKIDSGTVKASDDKTIGYIILPKDKSGMVKIGDKLYKKID